jgi:hypothetical protein
MKDERTRTVLFGMAAGVIATVVMDVFVAFAMLAMGNPVAFMFSFIGDVAAAFFSRWNAPIAGGVPWGLLFHYLFGLGYGGLFCALVTRIPRLRLDVIGKSILLGVVYIEVFSQPFLASAPLVREMAAQDILQWYALSTLMHAIYGAVLGVLAYYRTARLSEIRVSARA